MPAQIRIKRTFGTGLPDFPPVGTGVTDGELVYVYDTNNLGVGGSYRKLYIGSAAGVSTLAYPVGGQYYMERLPDSPFQEGVLLPRKVLSADANSVIDRIQVGSGLTVSGISTFKDNVNIEGNVSVDGNLDVTGDLTFDEFSARQVVISGVATVNQAVSIGGTLDVPEAYISSGIVTDIQVSGASTVTGIATFQSDVYVAGNLNVAGDIAYDEVRGRNLNISGVGTITNFNSGLGTITTLDTETFDALNAKITAGVVTSLVGTYATVSTVDVETLDAKNVNITGLAVTDVVGTAATITTIDASNLDALSANITGLAVTDIVGTAATITTIDSSKADLLAANINVGMITSAYITSGIVTDIRVSGASTVTGIATFQSDVYVSGNLSVSGDIVYDEVVGRNINISGVGTIANFNSGLGTITTLDVETLDARTANITGLAVTDVVGTAATITTLDVNAGDILNAKITAGVVTSLVGTYATVSTVDIETLDAKNVNITGLAVTDTVGTAATFTTLDVNTGDIQTLLVNAGLATDFAVTNLRSQTGIITNAYINSGVVTSLTGTYSTITNLVGTSGTFQDFDVNVNLNVDGHTELDQVRVTGVSTFQDVEINGDLNIYSPDVLIQNNLLVNGNLSVGGTFTSVNVADLQVNDKDLVLGITTNLNNDDVSTDDTANQGGISIASTEGSSLVSLQATGINTFPDTYKQIKWVKSGTFGIGTTDAWLFNYAVGVGSTNVPNQAYMAVGAHHFYERKIESPNITISENAIVSGILTGTTFDSETATIDNLQVTGTTTTGQLNVSGVSTFQGNVNLGDNDKIHLGDGNDLQIWHTGSTSVIRDDGAGQLILQSNGAGIYLQKYDSGGTNDNLARFITDGAVELYYDNSKKFETTGYGVTVTGLTFTNDLVVSGIATAATFQSSGGTYSSGSDTRTDASLVIEADNTIYTEHGGQYLRTLIENKSGAINIGQTGTGLVTSINLYPGNSGSTILYHGGANKKLQTTSGGVDVTGHTETDTLRVSGVSTFTGNIDANGNLDVDGHAEFDNVNISGVGTVANIEIGSASVNTINTLSGALTLDSEIGFNVAISTHTSVVGYLSATDGIYYEIGDFNGPNGIAYFDSTGLLVSSASTTGAASTSNYLLTTNASGVPVWTNVFDGGSF